MKSHILFPTHIWMEECHELMPMMEIWRSKIDLMRSLENNSKGRSTRLGWSGPKTLFDDADFDLLKQKCELVFQRVLKEMNVPNGFSFRVEAWGNVHETGGFNQPHIHREAILSACFYLHTPQGSGHIVFHDPRPATLYSRPWGRGINSWTKTALAVKAGSMLVFPHWLEHSVEPNDSSECRYSIAMNAILPGIKR